MSAPERAEPLPAWSLPAGAEKDIALAVEWPAEVSREWAFGGSTGSGVRVCILDSGVEPNHPLVGPIADAVAVVRDAEGEITIEPDQEATSAATERRAPASSVPSRPNVSSTAWRARCRLTGSGPILVAGLRYAIENGFDVVNMSLSTTKRDLAESLHELADLAYFQKTMLIASAHILPVESFPWRFASVLSVGSHDRAEPLDFFYNPEPPVEFFARGVDIDVAWLQGSSLRCTGNSFATPHMTGICALVLGSHPELTPFQLKSVLYLTATNMIGSR